METVFGQELKAQPSPRRSVFETRRTCCARLRLRRQTLLGKSLRVRRPMVPLKAAAMDLGLAKDILCAEPWWSRNPAPNMITVHSPEQMLDALVASASLLSDCHINGASLCSKVREIGWWSSISTQSGVDPVERSILKCVIRTVWFCC